MCSMFFFNTFLDIGTHLICSNLKRFLLRNPGVGAHPWRKMGRRLREPPGGDGALGGGPGLDRSQTMASLPAEVCLFLKTQLLWTPRRRTLWTVTTS